MTQGHRILVVDDQKPVLDAIRRILEREKHEVILAESAAQARAVMADGKPVDLVLCDVNLPGERGTTLLDELKGRAPGTVVVMVTAVADAGLAVECLRGGAYDYLLKPFDAVAMTDTVNRALVRRRVELDALQNREKLESMVQQRTRDLQQRTRELAETQRVILKALCRLAEFRDPEPTFHLDRVAAYSRLVAERLREEGAFPGEINDAFISNLVDAAPLHDIGTTGIPDHVLCKAGRHTTQEAAVMKRHPRLGADVFRTVRAALPASTDLSFVDLAMAVAECHHERFDGAGYPRGLSGKEIPLAARIVGLADFYDACTSPRVYRPEPIPHAEVKRMVVEGRGTQFDPVVVDAFLACEEEVLRVHQEMPD
jgi:putative two-component system response regulator